MAAESSTEVTLLLTAHQAGDGAAAERLLALVYGELHELADRLMRQQPAGHTLQPTALVHEAVLRLLGGNALGHAVNRRHLLAVSAQAMRQVLVDHARRRHADKRGGDRQRVALDDALEQFEREHANVLDLNEALEQLATLNERHSRIVVLRYFGGLSVAEVAHELELSESTVHNDFRFARAWLRQRLASGRDDI